MHYSKLVAIYKQLEATSKRLAQTQIISEFLKELSLDELGITILTERLAWHPR